MPPLQVEVEVSPVIIDPSMPSERALRAVADDVLAKLRYSFTTVATEEQPGAVGGVADNKTRLDDTFRDFIGSRSAQSRDHFRERSQALLGSPPALRSAYFGRYAQIDPAIYRTLNS